MTVGLLGMVCPSVMYLFFLMRGVKHHLFLLQFLPIFYSFWENFVLRQTALHLIIFKESFSIDERKLDIKNWSSLENVEISNLKIFYHFQLLV